MGEKEGLTQKEAEKKLKEYGYNKIEYFKVDLLEIIKRNSVNFFNLLLALVIILFLLLELEKINIFLMLFFLLLSIILSTYQDYKSNKITQELLTYFKNYAWVKRNGQWVRILQEEIVPGDYVKVISGYLIPADIKIEKAETPLVDESVITGESEPILKKEGDIAYLGTMLINGQLEGEVIATGSNSYFGSLAKKTLELKKESAYQKLLDDFARKTGYLAVLLCLLIIFINFLKPQPTDFREILIFAIVLVIAIVPEFLPATTVLALNLAGRRLAKKGTIIKRLSSLEDLGSVGILCTDKTGTITTNQLTLNKIISENEKEFIQYFLADYYLTKNITPYEIAFLEKFPEIIDFSNFELIEDIPFDPVKRVKTTIVKVKKNDQQFLITEIIKGAPEEVINLLKNEKEKWLEIFKKEDENGFRTLALGIIIKKENHLEIFKKILGIASFVDPLKESAFSAIKLAQKLGLEIKILTGDSPKVAYQVAQQLGIIKKRERVILGEELRKIEGEKLKEIIFKNKVFARLLPEDKLKIVEVLQKEKLVAFLGEGINDAPALKIVHSALVVDSANDVTKEEADIILKEKDLNLIVEGIYEGRKVLTNIGKYIKHTMSDNFGNLTSVAILANFLSFVPLTPIQVLLTDFLTDIPLFAFSNDNVDLKEIKRPVKFSSFHLLLLLITLGIIAGLTNITAYLLVKDRPPSVIQTYIFFITTMTGLVVSLLIRTKDWFIKSKPSFVLISTLLISILTTIAIVFIPSLNQFFNFSYLDQDLLIYSVFLILGFATLTEISKRIFYKFYPDVL